MRTFSLIFSLFICSCNAYAGIPSEYNAIQVKPPSSFTERVFDVSKAFEKARVENKQLFIYLGAEDCPPCKEYEQFLRKNHANLKDDFARYVVVDLKTWLKGPKIFLKINDEKIFINDFKERIGDQNKSLFFPSFWLIDHELKIVRQSPKGNTEFIDVDRHRKFLR